MAYIDKDKLLQDIGETVIFSGKPDIVSAESRGARKVVDRIAAAPTVDAVEVVRCKDCKHYGTSGCAMDAFSFDVTEESFCSYGERRENEQA
jgi:hypothetical protein